MTGPPAGNRRGFCFFCGRYTIPQVELAREVSLAVASEERAIELALHPEKLQGIKERLDQRRLTSPLFDTPLFARHMEAAFETMYRRYQAGLPPDHLEIPIDRLDRLASGSVGPAPLWVRFFFAGDAGILSRTSRLLPLNGAALGVFKREQLDNSDESGDGRAWRGDCGWCNDSGCHASDGRAL
jgi:hypothetical protein